MTNSVCFVVLHYGNNKQITIDAIKSVEMLSFCGQIDFLVVCNGKEYDIHRELEKEFSSKVSVILLSDNVGFSKANNIGYSLAKKRKDYDFIICINNDIQIRQKNFITILYQKYSQYKFYVAGPDVYQPNIDMHTSPMTDKIYGLREINDIIEARQRQISAFERKLSRYAWREYLKEASSFRKIISKNYKKKKRINLINENYTSDKINLVIQGSCIIFSRDFLCQNEKAFEPEVFLYFEEHYLAKKCFENNWPMYYLGQIQVEHYHRGSSGLTGMSYLPYCEKKKQMCKVFLNAAKEYREHLLQTNVNITSN